MRNGKCPRKLCVGGSGPLWEMLSHLGLLVKRRRCGELEGPFCLKGVSGDGLQRCSDVVKEDGYW